jgi:DNA-binding CsgD family transcriptional regulator
MVAGMSEDRAAALSRRELEVAELVAQGWTNREIAERLFISPRTVESHLDRVKSKLGLSRRPHIVAWALRQRLAANAPPDGRSAPLSAEATSSTANGSSRPRSSVGAPLGWGCDPP